ncbi:hypothetical protein BD311DRAFT_73525 [Dichomitus squalens]|uniref:Uncharacterized protein n=1 Tax=Dichomitus squalens TaxID=114155 RepID=A0A4Q9M8M0_9APHY|nr:hypothetical protein BD311DRAFT_73525 [Dichomitus squalens]
MLECRVSSRKEMILVKVMMMIPVDYSSTSCGCNCDPAREAQSESPRLTGRSSAFRCYVSAAIDPRSITPQVPRVKPSWTDAPSARACFSQETVERDGRLRGRSAAASPVTASLIGRARRAAADQALALHRPSSTSTPYPSYPYHPRLKPGYQQR